MASDWLHFILLLGFAVSAHLLQLTDFKVSPEKGTAGVFLLSSIPKPYALNVSAARDMCEHLGMTLANLNQIKAAQAHGLETCRYGWVEEQVAVIPRVTASPNCGRGGTGILVWRTQTNRSFDAFCFNGTALKMQLSSPTGDTSPRRGPTSPPVSSHPPPPPIPKSTSLTPTDSSPLLIHSTSSAYLSTSSPGCTDMTTATMSSEKPSDVTVAVIILITTAALLMLFSGMFYCRRKRSWLQICKRDLQRENKDTEELKPSGKQDAGGDEVEFEVDGNSNDISLSVVPDMEQESS